ncbi:MAG: cytochrome C oxidase subunit III [Gemmatimonadales bacterium]
MRATRAVADVRHLPRTVFGNRALMWWGTMGFVIIEGTTLFICAMTYFYLRKNSTTWPPEQVWRPWLVIPTIQVLVMLLSIMPMRRVERATHRMDLATVRTGLVICSLLILMMCVLRIFEFRALKVRWDTSAYGSAAWAVVFAHTTLLLLEAAETLAITRLIFGDQVEERDLSGVSDNALYWYFLTGVWVPLYIAVFLSPYFM